MTQDNPIDYTKLAEKIDPSRIVEQMDTGRIGDSDRFMLSRRQLAAIAGSGLGAGALSALGIGSADAQTSGQAGTIGQSGSGEVDIFSQDITNSGQLTTTGLDVSGVATGVGQLTTDSSITVEALSDDPTAEAFVTLFSSNNPKDVLGGSFSGDSGPDFLYEFDDGTTFTRVNGFGATSYTFSSGRDCFSRNASGDIGFTAKLPPAKDIVRIEVGHNARSASALGAEVVLVD
jgi:hypothetical protein